MEIARLETSVGVRISEATQFQIRAMLFTILGAVVLVLLAEALRGVVG